MAALTDARTVVWCPAVVAAVVAWASLPFEMTTMLAAAVHALCLYGLSACGKHPTLEAMRAVLHAVCALLAIGSLGGGRAVDHAAGAVACAFAIFMYTFLVVADSTADAPHASAGTAKSHALQSLHHTCTLALLSVACSSSRTAPGAVVLSLYSTSSAVLGVLQEMRRTAPNSAVTEALERVFVWMWFGVRCPGTLVMTYWTWTADPTGVAWSLLLALNAMNAWWSVVIIKKRASLAPTYRDSDTVTAGAHQLYRRP